MPVQLSSALSAPASTGLVARAASSPPEQVRRTERQVQTQEAEGQLQKELAGRVAQLVDRMEAVADRISAKDTSTPRRAVLVARFNELQRQVNELDGIAVAEGQETKAQKQVGTTSGASQASRISHGSARSRTSAASAPARGQARETARVSRGVPAGRQSSATSTAPAEGAKVDVLA